MGEGHDRTGLREWMRLGAAIAAAAPSLFEIQLATAENMLAGPENCGPQSAENVGKGARELIDLP